jgi:hypothetical protein
VDIKSLKAKIIEGDGRGDLSFEFKGDKFTIKPLTVAASRRVDNAAKDKSGKKDDGRWLVLIAAETIHYAETGERVFDSKTDMEMLESLSVGKGGFLATFIETYGTLETRDAKDAEQVF